MLGNGIVVSITVVAVVQWDRKTVEDMDDMGLAEVVPEVAEQDPDQPHSIGDRIEGPESSSLLVAGPQLWSMYVPDHDRKKSWISQISYA